MTRLPLLLILLLLPAPAFAQPAYDLTCEDVKKVLIVRMEDSWMHIHSPQGFIYTVSFRTRAERKEELQQLVNSSRRHRRDESGIIHYWNALKVTANGKPLQNDVPDIDFNGGGNIGTILFNEQDAFDAARAVWPHGPGRIHRRAAAGRPETRAVAQSPKQKAGAPNGAPAFSFLNSRSG
jgi:hypothetical protein